MAYVVIRNQVLNQAAQLAHKRMYLDEQIVVVDVGSHFKTPNVPLLATKLPPRNYNSGQLWPPRKPDAR